MMRSMRALAGLSVAALVAIGACTSAATPTPAPSVAPSAAPASEAPTPTPAPTTVPTVAPTATPAPTLVATIPEDQLVFHGKLIVCSDLPYPPLEYLDDQGNPIGSDMELAAGIAERLGLKLEVVNTVFDYTIAAVTAGKCDIVVSDQNITPDRTKQVDMIPYFQAGQAFAVLKGNPAAIATQLDVCGKKVGAETATTEIQYLEGTDLYKATGGLKKMCTDAGKAAPEPVPFEKDSDAFLALVAKQVDTYFADLPVVAYYVQAQPDQFEQAPIAPLSPIKAGISVPKDKTVVRDAVKAALLAMIDDGSYLQILKKYSVEGGALKASDIVVNQP